MTETLETLKAYWWLVTGPLTLALGAALLWLKTQFVTRAEVAGKFSEIGKSVEALNKSFDEYADETDLRLVRVETAMEHLPSKEDFTRLIIQAEKQATAMEAFRDMQKDTHSRVKRLEEFLILQGERK